MQHAGFIFSSGNNPHPTSTSSTQGQFFEPIQGTMYALNSGAGDFFLARAIHGIVVTSVGNIPFTLNSIDLGETSNQPNLWEWTIIGSNGETTTLTAADTETNFVDTDDFDTFALTGYTDITSFTVYSRLNTYQSSASRIAIDNIVYNEEPVPEPATTCAVTSLRQDRIRRFSATLDTSRRSLPSRFFAAVQPWFSSPRRWFLGTRTSSKNTWFQSIGQIRYAFLETAKRKSAEKLALNIISRGIRRYRRNFMAGPC